MSIQTSDKPIHLFLVFKYMQSKEDTIKRPIEVFKFESEPFKKLNYVKNKLDPKTIVWMFEHLWHAFDQGKKNILIHEEKTNSKEWIFTKDDNMFFYLVYFNPRLVERRVVFKFHNKILRKIGEIAPRFIQLQVDEDNKANSVESLFFVSLDLKF